jgi:hypothetical protein
VTLHKLLRKDFAAFKLRAARGRPEDGEATLSKFICGSYNQWELRTDHRKVSTKLFGQVGGRARVIQIQRQTRSVLLYATVSRSTPNAFDRLALPELPHDSVLTTTAADNKDVHNWIGTTELNDTARV